MKAASHALLSARLVICLMTASLSYGQTTRVLRFSKIWDGAGVVASKTVIVVKDNRIAEIAQDTGKYPPGAQVIDLHRYPPFPA